MNIESYFKRAKPGAGPAAAAGGSSGAGHAASEQPGGGSRRAKQPAADTPSAKDTAPSSDRGAAQQQQATPMSGPPVLARAASEQQPFSTQQQTSVKAAAEEPIDLCDEDDDDQATLDAATPRPGPTQQPASQQQQQRAAAAGPSGADATPASQADKPPPATPAAGAAAPGSSSMPPPSTSSHAKASASKVAPEAFLTLDQRQQLLDACKQELPLLEAALEQRPDLSAHLDAGSGKKALELKQQVSLLVEGASLPLAALAEHISSVLSSRRSSSGSPGKQQAATAAAAAEPAAAGPGSEAAAAPGAGGGPSALVVRNLIQDVASRKSLGLQDGTLENVDALQDASPAYRWCWELHTLVGLPKAAKQHMDAARKLRKQALERVRAVAAFIQLAQGFSKPTKAAEGKLARAAAKLAKLPTLAALQAAHAAAGAAAAQHTEQQAASNAEATAKEAQANMAKAEKQRQAEEQRAAREAEKAAKAAAKAAEAEEKARLKAEKEAEREAKARAKADDAAKKAAQSAKKKEAAEAAKAGFGTANSLHKSQHVLKAFFGASAQRPATPSGGDASQGAGSQMEGAHAAPAAAAAAGGGFNKDASAAKEAARVWVVARGPSAQQLAQQQELERDLPPYGWGKAAADAAVAPIPELRTALQERWGGMRHRRSNARVWGLPPSWARRPGGDPSARVRAAAEVLFGEGADLRALPVWRRKLVNHHDSVRPPFYGSVPCGASPAVAGRRPFGKDVALDYEVMSDQDWEEEPEGESLSADCDDGDDEGGTEAGDEEEEQGFVVGDGYLSDDEGMRDEDELLGGGCAGHEGADGGSNDSSRIALQHLEAVLEHARSKGRHVVLVNSADMQWEPTTQLAPGILSCLKGTVMPGASATPATPAELPHLFGAGYAAASAAAAAAAAAGGSGDGAAAAAGDAARAAGAARAGRPPSVFPDELMPALVKLVHNSSQPMEQLVKQFVESQAAAGIKVAKARVKDRIKEVATMRMVGRAPHYTIRPEVLAAVQQGLPLPPPAAPAAAAAGAAEAGPTDMQVDGAETPSVAAGASKRAAEGGAAPAQEGAAGSCPPSKKHKPTPAGGGIERFFSAAKAGPKEQQLQQTPPSTPKAQAGGTSLQDASGAAEAAHGSGDAGVTATRGGSSALPMLTPPSDAAAAAGEETRPGKGRHSPVPFRLNSMGADVACQQPPQQQQQDQAAPGRQKLPEVFGRRAAQQQQQAAAQGHGAGASASSGGLPGGAAAAGASSAKAVAPPELLPDGAAPTPGFWRQLATWIVAVREPTDADITAAFRVFDEASLRACIDTMPQMVLSAMVKTLGSSSQSLKMRAACACCIGNTVQGLVRREHDQQQGPAAAPQAGQQAAGTETPPPRPASAAASAAAAGASACASPAPSPSPRAAPVEASFEELCAEPGLLPNLLLCLNADKALQAARLALPTGSRLGPGASTQVDELAKNTARAAACMLLVGLQLPAAARMSLGLAECSAAAAAAAAELRSKVASTPSWRGNLRVALRSADAQASPYALMVLWALLRDSAAASQLLGNARLAAGLFKLVASRSQPAAAARASGKAQFSAVRKWCLLVLSQLLSGDATHRAQALPWQDPLLPLQPAHDEWLEVLCAVAALAVAGVHRALGGAPGGADADLLDRSLSLASVLAQFVGCQRQLGTSPRLAGLLQHHQHGSDASADADDDGGSLLQALQAVADLHPHTGGCEHAAVRARQLLDDATAADSMDAE